MATRQKARSRDAARKGNGRSASQKTEKYRFAQNVDGEETVAEHEYRSYAAAARDEAGDEPDVLLDVPVVKVDSIHLEVEDLEAQVSLQAKVLDLLALDVGVEVQLGKLRVDIKGVEAQALLKVRLDHVAAIVDRVMATLDRNPKLVESLGEAVEQVGQGTGHTLGAAGEAVGEIGEGAGQAVGEIGAGAGQGVGELGQGAGQAAGQVGEGAGQLVGNLDESVGDVAGAAGGITDAAGQLTGGGGGDSTEGAGGGGAAVGELTDPAGDLTAPKLAKAAAKTVAKEIGSAATDEAKDLGIAATHKVREMGQRRRRKRAERHHATDAALRVAEELGVKLDDVEGSGASGRITVGDVRAAAQEG